MKNLKSITLYTQIHLFCDNLSQKLLRLIIFSWESPKKVLDLLKDTQNSPFPWFNVVPSLEKLCQAMVGRNDQTNLQPTLNNGAGGASFTIFVIDMVWLWWIVYFLVYFFLHIILGCYTFKTAEPENLQCNQEQTANFP